MKIVSYLVVPEKQILTTGDGEKKGASAHLYIDMQYGLQIYVHTHTHTNSYTFLQKIKQMKCGCRHSRALCCPVAICSFIFLVLCLLYHPKSLFCPLENDIFDLTKGFPVSYLVSCPVRRSRDITTPMFDGLKKYDHDFSILY